MAATEVMDIDDDITPHDGPVAADQIANTQMNDVSTTDNQAATGSVASQHQLYEIPELAERYVPIISTRKGVEYRNPNKFCFKPPFWKKWLPHEYNIFAGWLENVDLEPLARHLNKPVQEVACMLDNLAIQPLYDAREASRRGQEGMERFFEQYRELGVKVRDWTNEPEKIRGEFSDTSRDSVHLILENGNVMKLHVNRLAVEDMDYLEKTVSPANRAVLYGPAEDKAEESAPTRDWTIDKIKGSLAGVTPGCVQLRLEDGKRRDVPLAQLTQVDRRYVRELLDNTSRTLIFGNQADEDEVQQAAASVAAQQDSAEEKQAESTVWLREWTDEKFKGTLADVSPGTLHLMLENGQSKDIQKGQLTEDDRNWVNGTVSKPVRLVVNGKATGREAAQAKAFLTAANQDVVFREWTSEKIRGSFPGVSPQVIHLALENGEKADILLENLTQDDQDWVNGVFDNKDVRNLKQKTSNESPAQAMVSQDTGSQDYTARGDTTQENVAREDAVQEMREMRSPENLIPKRKRDDREEDEEGRASSSATQHTAKRPKKDGNGTDLRDSPTDSDNIQVPTSGAGATKRRRALVAVLPVVTPELALEEREPAKEWTDDKIYGVLFGVSHQVAHLELANGQVKDIAFNRINSEDIAWLRKNIEPNVRKILSGQVRIDKEAAKKAQEEDARDGDYRDD